jgi:hypothetical protein
LELLPESLAVCLFEIFNKSSVEEGWLIGGDQKAYLLLESSQLLKDLHSIDSHVKSWLERFAWYLTYPSFMEKLAHHNHNFKAPSHQSLGALCKHISDLVEEIPENILKKTPDWQLLTTYQPPRTSRSYPATHNVSSIASGMPDWLVPQDGMPAPPLENGTPTTMQACRSNSSTGGEVEEVHNTHLGGKHWDGREDGAEGSIKQTKLE